MSSKERNADNRTFQKECKMEHEALWQHANELAEKLYGKGSPVSEEQIKLLVTGLRRERVSLAYDLVRASELSGFSPSEIIKKLKIDMQFPGAYEDLVHELCFACEDLQRKGYGAEIQRVLSTDGMFGREGEEPFLSPMSLLRKRNVGRLRDLIFGLPESAATNKAGGD